MKTLSEHKYLIDGSEVLELAKLPNGVLVCRIYEDPDSEEPTWDENRAFRVEKTYDTPPTEVVAVQVQKLLGEVSELQHKRDELQSLIREDRSKWSEIIKKCLQYKALENILEFVEGIITHYVIIHEYGGVMEILERSKSTCEFAQRGEVRLLTLYGKSNGDLQWRLSTYTDHSGYNKEVYPVRSITEALEVFEKLAQEKFKETATDGVVYMRALISNKIDSANKMAQSQLDLVEKYQKEADSLNEQLKKIGA